MTIYESIRNQLPHGIKISPRTKIINGEQVYTFITRGKMIAKVGTIRDEDCAPEAVETVAKRAIISAMVEYYIKQGDPDEAQKWLSQQ